MRRKTCASNISSFAGANGGGPNASSLNARGNSIIVGVSFAAKMRVVRIQTGEWRTTSKRKFAPSSMVWVRLAHPSRA